MTIKKTWPFLVLICFLSLTMGCGGGEKSIEGEWLLNYGGSANGLFEIKKIEKNYILQIEDKQLILTEENGIYKANLGEGETQFLYNPEADELLMNIMGKSLPLRRYDWDQFVGYWSSTISRGGKQLCAEISRRKKNFEIEYYLYDSSTGWKREKVNATFGRRKTEIVGTNKLKVEFPFEDQVNIRVPDARGSSFRSFSLSRLKSRRDFPDAVRNYKAPKPKKTSLSDEAKGSGETSRNQRNILSPKHKPTSYLIATVDQLNIRKAPRLDAGKVAQISEGTALTYLGKKTDFTIRITLRGKVHDEPWYKVMLADGQEGWVYGGAVEMREM
jgi:hypothetical protein